MTPPNSGTTQSVSSDRADDEDVVVAINKRVAENDLPFSVMLSDP